MDDIFDMLDRIEDAKKEYQQMMRDQPRQGKCVLAYDRGRLDSYNQCISMVRLIGGLGEEAPKTETDSGQ